MDSSRLPPETPRRQLLKRIHRRSSILPSMDPCSHLAAPSASSSTTSRSSSRRQPLNPDNGLPLLGNTAPEKHDEAEEDHGYSHEHQGEQHTQSYTPPPAADTHTNRVETCYDGQLQGDENGEEAAWAQVDELMDTVQLKNQRILELEKQVCSLQRDLQSEKERWKPSNGLTRAAAVKLEREFLSQEMILKGLQRDNEDKTLEVESLRRKIKVMSDFLARQYGADDWKAVVHASSGLAPPVKTTAQEPKAASADKETPSAVARALAASPRAGNRAKFTPVLGSEATGNPFSPATASRTKALGLAAINNDDVLIPTIARMQTPASSPSKMFVSSFAPQPSPMDKDQLNIAEQVGGEPSKTAMPGQGESRIGAKHGLPAGLDPNILLASIESVRLLIQGFERKNAMRRAQLETTIDDAIQAERRAERLQASASTATAQDSAPTAAAA
ncbi:uncharacterized protein UDID_02011 [Ustilago sp. UG-2017a]|nr:uncharacterized protein UDID_02011 [Ustilago sp. UG-2017a]